MDDTKRYRVNEIFYSLQGEGVYTGVAAVFVRFSGCNRCCSFCDTDFDAFTELTASEIVSVVREYPAETVILTGGEPAMQIDDAIVDALHAAGCRIHVETNGSLPLPEGIDWVTCSPKDRNIRLSRADEVKLVFTGEDTEWAASLFDGAVLSLQPLSCNNIEATVAYIKSHPWWRLSLQTHKLIDIP
ncbi:MAG: 7-carboxy-7-deazaguanine synthase QueE [Candidatus Amulumruptor sp.]